MTSNSLAILIIEDDWLVRMAIASDFQEAGWSVLESSTGEGALALFRARQPIDVVITDVRLAGDLTGWDVAEDFRAQRADVLIIYASGNLPEKSRMVPGSYFFPKPCRTAELLAACSRLTQTAASVPNRQ